VKFQDLQFIPYKDAHRVADSDLIVCDCYYHRGLNLVHLYSDRVPGQYRSNTSTEAVIKWLLDPSPDKPGKDATTVTCNHWDIDGFLSLWVALHPELALEYRDLLIATAHLGDFREFDNTSEIGLMALKLCSLLNVIEAKEFCLPFGDLGDATIEYEVSEQKFEYFLPRFEEWLANIDSYESLWRAEYDKVLSDLQDIDSGMIKIIEYSDVRVSYVSTQKPLHYYALFSRVQGGAIITELSKPHYLELEYRYETSVGRLDKEVINRKDLSSIAATLTEQERIPNVQWVFDNINEGGTMLRPESLSHQLSREERYQSLCYRGKLPETSITGKQLIALLLELFLAEEEKEQTQIAYAP
jgi:hypothetical protein